jgi:branched-chain amino acid transport system substrate-binding protein
MKRILPIIVGACWLGAQLHTCLAADEAKSGEAKPPIKIGAIFSVTGPAAFLGAPEEKTARMFVDKINAAGGINGSKLELVLKDSGGSPEKAVSFAKQLIEEDKVLAIIGPSTSGETMQIKALCEENKVPLISCAAAEVIVNPVAKYVFKVPQKDSQAVTWIYREMKSRGITNIAVLSGNDGFGKGGKAQLEAMAPEFGINIVANEVYDVKATDFSDIVTKIKVANPQAVVNWTVAPAQSIIPKNMKQLDVNVPLFHSHGFGNRKYAAQAGVAAEGILFPAGRLLVVDELPDTHPQKNVLAAYKKDYEAAYKEDVSTFGGHAYDAMLVVTEALKKAGVPERDKVRDAIENIHGLVGTAGIFNYSATDHTGLDLSAFEMLTVKDGKFVVYKK